MRMASGLPSAEGPDPRAETKDPMRYDEESPRTAFNRVGEEIEAKLEANPIIAWMRATNRRELVADFRPGSALLEIGCGSGADAVYFAETGCRVVALDISDRMVAATQRRAEARGVGSSVRAFRGRLIDLSPQLSELPWAPFDGVYANFSLTYEESLRSVGAIVHSLLRPGRSFWFTLPNRFCFSEPALALLRGHPGAIFARFREPRWLVIRDTRVMVHAYSAAEVRRALAGRFEILDYRGLPVFMPPSRLYDPSLEHLRKDLERLDERFDRSFPWRELGDTTLYHARKVVARGPSSAAEP